MAELVVPGQLVGGGVGYDASEVEHDAVVGDYLARKPKGKHGAHNYTFAEVGLDEASVRATFARYVAHYGIIEE